MASRNDLFSAIRSVAEPDITAADAAADAAAAAAADTDDPAAVGRPVFGSTAVLLPEGAASRLSNSFLNARMVNLTLFGCDGKERSVAPLPPAASAAARPPPRSLCSFSKAANR